MLIILTIIKTKESGQTLNLDLMRNLIQVHCVEGKNQIPIAAIKMITTYKLYKNIENENFDNNNFYNEILSKQEYLEMENGSKTKEILFTNKDLPVSKKKENFEYFTKLFYLLADKDDGISAKGLSKAFDITYEMIEKGNIISIEEASSTKYKSQAEEILNLLGRSSSEKLTPEDFINIMTSNVDYPNEISIK